MIKKKKKTVTCIECEEKTDNFYPVPNNRGTLYKCKECYELSLARSCRNEYSYRDIHYIANAIKN